MQSRDCAGTLCSLEIAQPPCAICVKLRSGHCRVPPLPSPPSSSLWFAWGIILNVALVAKASKSCHWSSTLWFAILQRITFCWLLMYSLSMLVAACNSSEVVLRLVVTQSNKEGRLAPYQVQSFTQSWDCARVLFTLSQDFAHVLRNLEAA